MRPRLTLPTKLAFTTIAVGALSCSSSTTPPPSATDAAMDVSQPVDVAVDTGGEDTCPDPLACYSTIVPDGDGGAFVVYQRRDGSVTDVACPPVPNGCAVA